MYKYSIATILRDGEKVDIYIDRSMNNGDNVFVPPDCLSQRSLCYCSAIQSPLFCQFCVVCSLHAWLLLIVLLTAFSSHHSYFSLPCNSGVRLSFCPSANITWRQTNGQVDLVSATWNVEAPHVRNYVIGTTRLWSTTGPQVYIESHHYCQPFLI